MCSWNYINFKIRRGNNEDDINRLIKCVRPHWKKAATEFPQEGVSNQTVICHNSDDNTEDHSYDDAIVIRIRHQSTEGIYLNLKNEIPVIVKASEAGLCGKILATFQNGTILQYVPEEVMKWSELQNPEILGLCAESLADFHSLQWTEGDLPNASTQSELKNLSRQPKLFPRLQEVIAHLSEHPKSSFFDEMWKKSELSAEVDCISKIVDGLCLPIVFSHNDFQVNNIIYNKTEKKVYLIDYECTSFNYGAVDIANLFNETAWKMLGLIPANTAPPSDNLIQQFIHVYTRRRFSLKPEDQEFENITENYFKQVKAFQTVLCLYWSCIAMSNFFMDDSWANGNVDFKSLTLGFKRKYLQEKDEMFKLLSSLEKENNIKKH